MKITDVKIVSFGAHADRFDTGHAQPKPRTELVQTLASIETDAGVSGYYFGGGSHGDQEGLRADDQSLLLEAPNKEAAIRVHREAHSLLPDEIYEVKEGA